MDGWWGIFSKVLHFSPAWLVGISWGSGHAKIQVQGQQFWEIIDRCDIIHTLATCSKNTYEVLHDVMDDDDDNGGIVVY